MPGGDPPASVARESDVVIYGRLRAWLLRLPFLDVGASVVITTARPRGQAQISGRGGIDPPPRDDVQAQPALTRGVRRPAEGSRALDDGPRPGRIASEVPEP